MEYYRDEFDFLPPMAGRGRSMVEQHDFDLPPIMEEEEGRERPPARGMKRGMRGGAPPVVDESASAPGAKRPRSMQDDSAKPFVQRELTYPLHLVSTKAESKDDSGSTAVFSIKDSPMYIPSNASEVTASLVQCTIPANWSWDSSTTSTSAGTTLPSDADLSVAIRRPSTVQAGLNDMSVTAYYTYEDGAVNSRTANVGLLSGDNQYSTMYSLCKMVVASLNETWRTEAEAYAIEGGSEEMFELDVVDATSQMRVKCTDLALRSDLSSDNTKLQNDRTLTVYVQRPKRVTLHYNAALTGVDPTIDVVISYGSGGSLGGTVSSVTKSVKLGSSAALVDGNRNVEHFYSMMEFVRHVCDCLNAHFRSELGVDFDLCVATRARDGQSNRMDDVPPVIQMVVPEGRDLHLRHSGLLQEGEDSGAFTLHQVAGKSFIAKVSVGIAASAVTMDLTNPGSFATRTIPHASTWELDLGPDTPAFASMEEALSFLESRINDNCRDLFGANKLCSIAAEDKGDGKHELVVSVDNRGATPVRAITEAMTTDGSTISKIGLRLPPMFFSLYRPDTPSNQLDTIMWKDNGSGVKEPIPDASYNTDLWDDTVRGIPIGNNDYRNTIFGSIEFRDQNSTGDKSYKVPIPVMTIGRGTGGDFTFMRFGHAPYNSRYDNLSSAADSETLESYMSLLQGIRNGDESDRRVHWTHSSTVTMEDLFTGFLNNMLWVMYNVLNIHGPSTYDELVRDSENAVKSTGHVENDMRWFCASIHRHNTQGMDLNTPSQTNAVHYALSNGISVRFQDPERWRRRNDDGIWAPASAFASSYGQATSACTEFIIRFNDVMYGYLDVTNMNELSNEYNWLSTPSTTPVSSGAGNWYPGLLWYMPKDADDDMEWAGVRYGPNSAMVGPLAGSKEDTYKVGTGRIHLESLAATFYGWRQFQRILEWGYARDNAYQNATLPDRRNNKIIGVLSTFNDHSVTNAINHGLCSAVIGEGTGLYPLVDPVHGTSTYSNYPCFTWFVPLLDYCSGYLNDYGMRFTVDVPHGVTAKPDWIPRLCNQVIQRASHGRYGPANDELFKMVVDNEEEGLFRYTCESGDATDTSMRYPWFAEIYDLSTATEEYSPPIANTERSILAPYHFPRSQETVFAYQNSKVFANDAIRFHASMGRAGGAMSSMTLEGRNWLNPSIKLELQMYLSHNGVDSTSFSDTTSSANYGRVVTQQLDASAFPQLSELMVARNAREASMNMGEIFTVDHYYNVVRSISLQTNWQSNMGLDPAVAIDNDTYSSGGSAVTEVAAMASPQKVYSHGGLVQPSVAILPAVTSNYTNVNRQVTVPAGTSTHPESIVDVINAELAAYSDSVEGGIGLYADDDVGTSGMRDLLVAQLDEGSKQVKFGARLGGYLSDSNRPCYARIEFTPSNTSLRDLLGCSENSIELQKQRHGDPDETIVYNTKTASSTYFDSKRRLTEVAVKTGGAGNHTYGGTAMLDVGNTDLLSVRGSEHRYHNTPVVLAFANNGIPTETVDTGTITIPAGNYRSVDEFTAVVNSKLQAVGNSFTAASELGTRDILVGRDFSSIKKWQLGANLALRGNYRSSTPFAVDLSTTDADLQALLGTSSSISLETIGYRHQWSKNRTDEDTLVTVYDAGFSGYAESTAYTLPNASSSSVSYSTDIKAIYVETNFAKGGLNQDGQLSQVLAVVPVTATAPGERFTFTQSNLLQVDCGQNLIGDSHTELEFRLVDQDRNPIVFTDTTDPWILNVVVKWKEEIKQSRLRASATETTFR